MSKASNDWMFLLNSIIQVLISAQKSCNCLAAVDEAAQKAPQKSTVCPIKFKIFIGPHRRCHSDFKLYLKDSNPPLVNFFLVSSKKQTDLNVRLEVIIPRLDVLYNFKETSVKRWKQVTSAPTLFYCFGTSYLSAC